MANVGDDIYAKIAGAKASNGGNNILDGEYLLGVEQLILEKKYSGVCFIAELRVIESAPVSVSDELRKPNEIGKDLQPSKVGSHVGYVCPLDKNVSAAGNAKAFLLGLDGTPEDEIDPAQFVEMIKSACSKDQPFRGALVRCTSFRKVIKSGPNLGKPFTGYKWQFVEQTLEEIATRRAQWEAEAKAKQSPAA
jgi:hypothetical protein